MEATTTKNKKQKKTKKKQSKMISDWTFLWYQISLMETFIIFHFSLYFQLFSFYSNYFQLFSIIFIISLCPSVQLFFLFHAPYSWAGAYFLLFQCSAALFFRCFFIVFPLKKFLTFVLYYLHHHFYLFIYLFIISVLLLTILSPIKILLKFPTPPHCI